MADQTVSGDCLTHLAYQLIDGLTVMKLQNGRLRLHLHDGTLDPTAIETRFRQLDEEIDALGDLAQAIRAWPTGFSWRSSD